MTIAIHISRKDDIHGFVLNSFIAAAKDHPDDHFIFIADKPSIAISGLPANCTPVIAGPEIKNSLLRYYWYNYKIPSILNRYQAGVLFTPREVCSLNTTVPQIMLFSEVMKPAGGRRGQLRKKYSEKAFRIGVFERAVLSKAEKYFPKSKLIYLGHGLQSQNDKKTEAAEEPYFAAVISKHNRGEVVQLLKAFSLFKKWQRSAYKLILILNDINATEAVPNFSTYKYRHDVRIVNEVSAKESMVKLSAAYTVIQLFNAADGMRKELEAMKSGVPLISTCPEKERDDYLQSAALYTKNTDTGIAEQMMRLYKDENTYREFSVKSRQFAGSFSWAATSATLYRMAEEAVAQRL